MTRATRLVQGVIRLFYKAWVGLGVWGRADYHYSGQGTPLTPKAQIYRLYAVSEEGILNTLGGILVPSFGWFLFRSVETI